MGIYLLYSHCQKCDLFERRSFSNCYWLVDGNAMTYTLFGSVFINMYVGDYTEIVLRTEEFLKIMSKANISPVFIFDGATPLTKFECKEQRIKNQKATCEQFSESGDLSCVKNLLSPFAQQIFIHTLRRNGIAVFRAEFEADELLFQVSHKYNWPIVSRDTDFFLGQTPVILLDESKHVQTTFPLREGLDGTFEVILKVFDPNFLIQKYRIQMPNALRVISVLLYNDFSEIHCSKSKTQTTAALQRYRKSSKQKQESIKGDKVSFDRIFRDFAKLKSIEDLKTMIFSQKLSLSEKKYADYLFAQAREIQTDRNFQIEIDPFSEEFASNFLLNIQDVPAEFNSLLMSSIISKHLLQIILTKHQWIVPIVEGVNKESSFYPSIQFWRKIHQLVVPKVTCDIVYSSHDKIMWQPLYHTAQLTYPTLKEIFDFSPEQRFKLFLSLIHSEVNISRSFFKNFPAINEENHKPLFLICNTLHFLKEFIRNSVEANAKTFARAVIYSIFFAEFLYDTSAKLEKMLTEESAARNALFIRTLKNSPVLLDTEINRCYGAFQYILETWDYLARILLLDEWFISRMMRSVNGKYITVIYDLIVNNDPAIDLMIGNTSEIDRFEQIFFNRFF